ncbi:MAG: heavy metal-responsive transcriptional regulator [Spirochaetia bacterium]|nr:heavy metal-responsive transcriptional regulator [Spirochaetia bacterium]
MTVMTIGEVARRAHVGIETIRYYEREGLVPEPERSDAGYRQFPPETLQLLDFITHAKRLGFSLKEIRELLALRVDHTAADACDDMRRHAEIKLEEVRERINSLRLLKQLDIFLKSKNPVSPVAGNLLEYVVFEENLYKIVGCFWGETRKELHILHVYDRFFK